MPDAVELDPVGLGETLQVAGGGAGPREDAVVGAPNDPHRALDPVRVEGPADPMRYLDQREAGVARGGAAELVHEELDRDVLVAHGDVDGRPAAALRFALADRR